MANKPSVRPQQAKGRDKSGQFAKGNSGNPGGRKSPAKKALEKLLQEALEKHALPNGKTGNFVFDKAWEIVENTDNEQHLLAALKFLAEYAYGKPAQRLKLSNDTDDQGQALPLILS